MENFLKDKIAILIVTYNALHTVKRCLSTLSWSNKLPNVKVFLVDNNSTEPVADYVQNNVPWVHLTRSKSNSGFGAGMNQALRASSEFNPDYVLLVNPDLLLDYENFIKLIKKTNTLPIDTGITAPAIYTPDGTLEMSVLKDYSLLNIGLPILLNLLGIGQFMRTVKMKPEVSYVDAVSGACMLIQKELIKQIGFFDERFFMYCEDNDLCKRARNAGWQIAYVPDARCLHFRGKSSEKVGNQKLWLKEQLYISMLKYFRKHKGSLQTGVLKAFWKSALKMRILLNKDRAWAERVYNEISKI